MLKVGDKVRVRKDLQIADYIDGYYVTRSMYSKIGQVVTISDVVHGGYPDFQCYQILELPSFGVAFTDGMFELDYEDTLNCPNCGKHLHLERTNFYFNGALYDVYGCDGCSHITVFDWREDFDPIAGGVDYEIED